MRVRQLVSKENAEEEEMKETGVRVRHQTFDATILLLWLGAPFRFPFSCPFSAGRSVQKNATLATPATTTEKGNGCSSSIVFRLSSSVS